MHHSNRIGDAEIVQGFIGVKTPFENKHISTRVMYVMQLGGMIIHGRLWKVRNVVIRDAFFDRQFMHQGIESRAQNNARGDGIESFFFQEVSGSF